MPDYAKKKVSFHKITLYDKENAENILKYNDFDFETFINWLRNLPDRGPISPYGQNKVTMLTALQPIPHEPYQRLLGAWFLTQVTFPFGTNRRLRHAETGQSRSNPKDLKEGEEEQNFIAITNREPGVYKMVFQENGNGIIPLKFVQYLETKINRYFTEVINEETPFRIEHETEITDVETLLDRVARLQKTRIKVNKDVVTELFGLTDTDNIKREVVIEMTAQDNGSLKSHIQNIMASANSESVFINAQHANKAEVKFWVDNATKNVSIKIQRDPVTKVLSERSAFVKITQLIE